MLLGGKLGEAHVETSESSWGWCKGNMPGYQRNNQALRLHQGARTANVASYLIGWGLLAATPTAVGVTDSYLIACCHHLQLLPRRPGVAQRPSPRRGQQRRCPPPDAQPADHLEQRLMLRLLKQIQHPRVELAQLDDPLCRRGMAGCGVQRMPGGAPPAGAHGSRGAGARTPAKLWWQTHSPPCHPTQTSAAPPDARKQTKHGTAAQNTGPHLEEAAAELLRKQLSPGAHQAALALYCGCQRLQADCRQGRRASGLARCPGRCRCWFGGWARQQLLAARRHSLCVGALYGRQWAGNGWHEAGAAPKAMKQQPGSNPVQAARRQRWRRRRWRRWRSTVYLWWLPRLLCASICAAVGRGSPARRRLQRSLLAAAQGAALPVLWLLPIFVVKKTSPPLQLAHERSRGSRISRAGKSSPRVTHGRKLEPAPMLKLLAVGLLAISCAWAAPDPALTAGQVTADFGGGGRRRRRRPLPPVLLVWQRNRMLGLTASLPCPCISPGRNADGRVGAGERRSPVWCEAQLGRGPAVLSCACPAHLTHAMPYSLPLT